jgi:hypothetical protein
MAGSRHLLENVYAIAATDYPGLGTPGPPRVFNAPINEVVEPATMPTVDALANQCIEGAFDLYVRGKMSAPLATTFLSVKNPATVEP